MSKEILLITNYFPPEKGAAANRMQSIAKGMARSGYTVKIVCPLPNYPKGKIFDAYTGKLYLKENVSYGKITRLWVWPSNSTNKFLRLLSMVSFSFSLVLFFIFTKTPKKIFIQYSPVFIGFTSVFWSRLFAKKIILNVSDLWPLAGLEMGILNRGWHYSLLLKMERYCYRNATLIVGQSEEILQYISHLEKEKPLFLYRNVPNFETSAISQTSSSKEIKIVYAGLLGIAQGIFEICQQITFPENVSLHIYGAGPEAEKLQDLKKQRIFFYGELEREVLHKELPSYDIAFVPLAKRIYGSVPSKIFEYTCLGLPVLYFAGGEGGDIVKKESLGWVIPVQDYKALQDFISTLSEKKLKQFPKEDVQKNSVIAFDFQQQFKEFTTLVERI